jgi:hypothetical protein
MVNIFISYSRRDTDFVRMLEDALRNKQYKTWVDWKDILHEEEWWQTVKRAIEGADLFLLILSPDYVASKHCSEEIDYAYQLNKQIMPILRRPLDGIPLDPRIAKFQWLPFRESDKFELSLHQLIDRIEFNKCL